MDTAKIFESGRSQAVRLPKQYRFEESEVFIKKLGNMVIMMPKDKVWGTFLDGINGFTNDFFSEGRAVDIPVKRESL